MPGCANPRHLHPNCEEILHVLQGTITHTGKDTDEIMHIGDTISVPVNTLHNARNIGDDWAILLISFSSPNRLTQGE
jgi:quercetin dioxygenase-like cupin family protein